MDISVKYGHLLETLKVYSKVLVAFSGGVDSTLVLKGCVDALGGGNVVAAIAVGALWPGVEVERARELCGEFGVELVEVDPLPLEDVDVCSNLAERCYFCKKKIFTVLGKLADERGCDAVLCGSNVDDLDDYRPGNRAVAELGVGTPLVDAGFSKGDVRAISRELGLSTADLPASPCLASRIEYGLELTAERFGQVEEAESFLRGFGFSDFRVRHHGDLARVEVCGDDMIRVLEMREEIAEKLKGLGFKFVTLDIEGFRSGSLNKLLGED